MTYDHDNSRIRHTGGSNAQQRRNPGSKPKYDNTPWWEKEEKEKRQRKENSFYTNERRNGTIKPKKPRFNNLTGYREAIDAKQKQLDEPGVPIKTCLDGVDFIISSSSI